MKLLDKLQGEESLDTTLTIKIPQARKDELIEFCKDNRISMGKLTRMGIDLITEQLKKEIADAK